LACGTPKKQTAFKRSASIQGIFVEGGAGADAGNNRSKGLKKRPVIHLVTTGTTDSGSHHLY
jgi:hypothetical protein